jgi:hypothetical protein
MERSILLRELNFLFKLLLESLGTIANYNLTLIKMKNLILTTAHKFSIVLLVLTNLSMLVFAQDSTASSTTTSSSRVTTETTSFVEPWVWVVGAAVLIILIVLLTRGSSSSRAAATRDKVTYTKEVSREDDL